MRLNVSTLQTAGGDFPPVKSELITLIRIADCEVTVAVAVSEKKAMFNKLCSEDTLLAVWTGKWKSNVFHVDDPLVEDWKHALT